MTTELSFTRTKAKTYDPTDKAKVGFMAFLRDESPEVMEFKKAIIRDCYPWIKKRQRSKNNENSRITREVRPKLKDESEGK